MTDGPRIPCSVGILTFNSAATLRRALDSVRRCDDLIICDGGSTDETLAIAAKYGCRIVRQDERFQDVNGRLIDYSGVRNQALDAARNDWFLYIDSDEVATPELMDEIAAIVTGPEKDVLAVYAMSPRIVYDGIMREHSSNYPGWQNRFFHRGTGARFVKPVHERIEYDMQRYPRRYLRGHWHYFSGSDKSMEKLTRYALMEASFAHATTLARVLWVTWGNFVIIAKVSVKSVWRRFRFPFSTHVPLTGEWRRILIRFIIIRETWRLYLNR